MMQVAEARKKGPLVTFTTTTTSTVNGFSAYFSTLYFSNS